MENERTPLIDASTRATKSSTTNHLVDLFAPPSPTPPTSFAFGERVSTERISNEQGTAASSASSFLSPSPSKIAAAGSSDLPSLNPFPALASSSEPSSAASEGRAIIEKPTYADSHKIAKEEREAESDAFADLETLRTNHRASHDDRNNQDKNDIASRVSSWFGSNCSHCQQSPIVRSILGQPPSTIAGACMFLLYHVVFVLAFGSALMRPRAAAGGTTNGLGVMAKLVAIGIISAGPLYIARLNHDIPAVYPSVDLFLAPFFAQAAALVDQSLWEQYQPSSSVSPTTTTTIGTDTDTFDDNDEASSSANWSAYPDEVFFGSFAVLASLGMALAGVFLWLGSRFKLANLGTYLPYSVLSGFFSAVGVLLWCLAFSVDTNGQTWKSALWHGDMNSRINAFYHHAPSLFMGILMNKLGPKNPFYVMLLILMTILIFYITMWATETSLEDAQAQGWLWSVDELVYDRRDENSTGLDHGNSTQPSNGVPAWALPPAPFGSFAAIWAGHVNWTAVSAGLSNMFGLAFLYLLRSSIHASALKKNVSNLVMRIPILKQPTHALAPPTAVNSAGTVSAATSSTACNNTLNGGATQRQRPSILQRMRESVRILQMSMKDTKPLRSSPGPRESSALDVSPTALLSNEKEEETSPGYMEIRPKVPRRSLESIFSEYAYALFAVSVVGGFGVCPTVATSNTMYAIGADGAAPQYGSILLLAVFYLFDFRMVQYIPKTAFSSLLVLGAVDTIVVWFIGAYRKTQDLAEWLVVPMIAACSLFVGFLNAVFLGIAVSMFVFVASFFQVGVVKYSASGLEIRSRIERSVEQSAWLNNNGDLCQVLVLQNYLFFGNASTILNYIATMFEDVTSQAQPLDFSIPPFPKIVVVDLSLVTGMDTSTVDVFAEIHQFCSNNDCKLFLSGLFVRMKKGLALGGVKPDSGTRSESGIRFFTDLDTALGRAEDYLIQTEMSLDTTRRPSLRNSQSNESLDGGVGFRRALKQIDALHGLDCTRGLLDLQPFTEPIELQPGQCLYACDGGLVEESRRGLFFIEEGLLKIERDSSQSLTWTRTRGTNGAEASMYTLRNQHARMGTVARRAAQAKSGMARATNLRLARLGPGWIPGTLNLGEAVRSSGITIAVTKCRLHHLPYSTLEQIEVENPALVLRLYKLVTHLRAYREEATIEQLTTLNNIMTSPAHSKPISRAARQAFAP